MSGAPGEQGLVGKRPRTDDEGLFLLSLDGGGVRGLSSLMVLKRIMEAIEPDNPPRPCDYFDMIGGTSTGGLIAIMLGRMRLTIDECITAYSELAPKAFAKVHHRINLRGEAQGRFDHVALQEGIKSLLKKNGFNPECLLKEPEGDSPCKVFVLFHQCAQCHKVDTPTDNYGNTSFVCATSQHASRPVVFSTYRNARRGNDWLHRVKIWEAARATSAATTFFEPLTIDGETFVDGATGANNPVNYLWSEAAEIWGDEGTLDPSRVHCLISIGTGFPAHASFGPNVASIAKALKVISTDTEVTANVFQKHHASLFDDGRAFRFNVPAGLEHVGLHEVDQWDQIKISTRAYMQVEDTLAKLGKCASILQLRHSTQRLAEAIDAGARPMIEYFNNPDNIRAEVDLQSLTHTNVYRQWCNSSSLETILWYDMSPSTHAPLRSSVAASLAHHHSSSGDTVSSLQSPLYFQCHLEPSDGSVKTHARQGPVSARAMLASLICQAYCRPSLSRIGLTPYILPLTMIQKQALQRAITEPHKLSIEELSKVLLTATTSDEQPACIAIDNIHLIDVVELEEFIIVLMSRSRDPSQLTYRPVPLVFSGLHPRSDAALYYMVRLGDETEYQECLQSLHFEDWNTRQEQIEGATEGTNEWVWSHPEYKSWSAASRGVLWIVGKPGSGKSVIARTLQKTVVSSWGKRDPGRSTSSQTSIAAGWFYSTRLGDVGTSHISLLRSIIYQLLSQDPALFRIVVEHYRQASADTLKRSTVQAAREARSTGKRPYPAPTDPHSSDLESWCQSSEFESVGRKILERISSTGTSIVFIIDGLDEATPELRQVVGTDTCRKPSRIRTILGVLSNLVVGIAVSRMKFIVLSRPEPQIEMDFVRTKRKLGATFRITLEDTNQGDIDVLVRRGLEDLKGAMRTYHDDSDSESDEGVDLLESQSAVHSRPPPRRQPLGQLTGSHDDTLHRIREYILQNARGVILWVTLILKDLQQVAAGGMVTFLELESRLKSLPLELDDLYERVVRDLSSKLTKQELQKSRNILLLVSRASLGLRSLTLQELREALAVPPTIPLGIESESDPLEANRVIITSWANFRRQLYRYCGIFIEFIRRRKYYEDESEVDMDADDKVQFMHRTVKDFLEARHAGDPFWIPEDAAESFAEDTATRYISITCHRDRVRHYCHTRDETTPSSVSNWKANIASLVKYLDQCALLHTATYLVAQSADTIDWLAALRSASILSDLDETVGPSSLQWRDSQVRDLLADEMDYYPTLYNGSAAGTVQGVLFGYSLYTACLQGSVIALSNLVALSTFKWDSRDTETNPNFGSIDYFLRTAALRAAIECSLLNETVALNSPRGLTYSIKTFTTVDKDPFVRLANRCETSVSVARVVRDSAAKRAAKLYASLHSDGNEPTASSEGESPAFLEYALPEMEQELDKKESEATPAKRPREERIVSAGTKAAINWAIRLIRV